MTDLDNRPGEARSPAEAGATAAPDQRPQRRPTRDMAVYERLIRQGIREADDRESAVDHVTARRMAIWLVPRSRDEPQFIRGLASFAKTGGITRDLKDRLRHHARSADHPNRKTSARLLQYVIDRGTDLGPIGRDFGGACDQIDRADAMLTSATACTTPSTH